LYANNVYKLCQGGDAYACVGICILALIIKIKEEIKMIGIEQYRKIQEYKALGLAQTIREAEKERYHMDNYRQYILEHLKICPQMRDTNIYLKLVETFPDLQVKRATFYRYMKALREQHGYQHTSKRKISPREVSPPGYEAQYKC
jgi:predicted DNA-binding transcriptional regulator AlpA